MPYSGNVKRAIVVVALPLAACFPYVTTYVHLDAPGIAHRRSICWDVGPPAFARVERNGTVIDVAMTPGWGRNRDGVIWVNTSIDKAVSLQNPVGSLASDVDSTLREFALHGIANPNPGAEPMLRKQGRVQHQFRFDDLRPLPDAGYLDLPAVLVGDETFEIPRLRFERRSYAGIAPLNC